MWSSTTSLTTTNASADVLMNRLVDFDTASGKVVASLADSWEVTPDGLTRVYKVRPDVKFHNTEYFNPTRELTAEDVIFSFERMLDPKKSVAQSRPERLPARTIDAIAGADQEDRRAGPADRAFHLDHPDSTFLAT